MQTNRKTAQKIVFDTKACKGCHLCIDQCPQDVLAASPRRNAKGYLMPLAERMDDCIACMVCEMICPDLAITVEVKVNAK